MRERIIQLIERVDAMELRQRIMLLAAGLIVVFYMADTFAIQPAVAQQKTLRQAVGDWESKLDALRERTGILTAIPSDHASSAHSKMHARLTELESRIQKQMGGLLAPAQAIKVLEQVLEQEQDLKLLKVNASSSPLGDNDVLTDSEQPHDTGINRYRMQLQLEGSYLATLRYLRALENLPWKFFWEGVEYEVIEYPTARITIDLYTLGIRGDG
jgi:MSHA biogenesis protein MshJ